MKRLGEFLQDDHGAYSATRLAGISSAFTLCAMGLAQAFSPLEVTVDARLIQALEYVTIGCLLWSTVAKFSKHSVPEPKNEESKDG